MFLSPYRSYQLYYEYKAKRTAQVWTSNVASLQAFRQLKEGYVWRLPLQYEFLYEVAGSWTWSTHTGGQGASGMGILLATIHEACFWRNEELAGNCGNLMKLNEICRGAMRSGGVSLSLSLCLFFLYISLPQEFSWTFRHYVRREFPILQLSSMLFMKKFDSSMALHQKRWEMILATSGPERCRCDW